jgi:hypothetical protein
MQCPWFNPALQKKKKKKTEVVLYQPPFLPHNNCTTLSPVPND